MSIEIVRVLCRRKGYVDNRKCFVCIRHETLDSTVVVVIRIDPEICFRQTKLFRRSLETDINAKMRETGFNCAESSLVASGLDDARGQQLIERIADAGRRDHALAFNAMSIIHFNATYLAVFNNNLTDARVGKHLAPGRLNFRDDAIRDLPRTTNRIETAVQIVTHTAIRS